MSDLRTRRIPNSLTISAVVMAVALNLWRAGAAGGMTSAALGPKGALLAAGWTLLLGAAGALLILAALAARPAAADSRVRRLRNAAGHRFPYGLAIACGTTVSLAWS